MKKIAEIINKIRRPLLFAARDSYRHLMQLKDLEVTITSYLAELEAALTEEPAEEGKTKDDYRNLVAQLKMNLPGLDKMPPERKKTTLETLRRLVDEFASSPPHSSRSAETPLPACVSRAELRLAQEKLSQSIETLPGVGPRTAALLRKKGLARIEDLLYYLPRAYEDRRQIHKIATLSHGALATVLGVVKMTSVKMYGRRPVFEVVIDDGSGQLTAKWFRGNRGYLEKSFRPEAWVIMTATVNVFMFGKEMIHPDYEFIGEDTNGLIHFQRIVPIYSETEGLYQKTIRKIMYHLVVKYASLVLSPIPEAIVRKRNLIPGEEAIHNAHFPPDHYDPQACNQAKTEAHRRLIYEEFFYFQLGAAMKKAGRHFEQAPCFKPDGAKLNVFYQNLPFSLTAAQRRVIAEIEGDLTGRGSMHRLLQGDVGAGKTVVAAAAMILACDNGYQAVLMAPTEILAEQHYRTMKSWCEPLGLEVLLLTGRLKNRTRTEILEKIAGGQGEIVIGTHAVLEPDVNFARLGLIVIDEQHRFGVTQRSLLRKKGPSPHVLVMTATPIPRTLAMTVYGDLDVSVIDELPPGKKPTRTQVFTEEKRSLVYQIIEKEIGKGNQAFIVYPLVEESEALDLKDATNMAAHLQSEVFPHLRLGLIHGRLKSSEKDEIMTLFKSGNLDILVATTVIEVGIDIPEASVMVVEHAERFGLSQLHQLRGRVGRGEKPAFCLLMTHGGPAGDALRRLKIMEKTSDGFAIAEEDLAIRGPGEFMGTRQSGLPDFRLGNIIRDARILAEARADAAWLIQSDPLLEKAENQAVKEMMISKWQGRLELIKTG